MKPPHSLAAGLALAAPLFLLSQTAHAQDKPKPGESYDDAHCMSRGSQTRNQGKYADSIAWFRQIKEASPQYGRAQREIVTSAMRQKDWPAAYTAFANYFKSTDLTKLDGGEVNGTNVTDAIELAKEFEKKGDAARGYVMWATAMLYDAKKKGPFEMFEKRTQELFKKPGPKKIAELSLEILATHKDKWPVQLNLADAYWRMGKHEEAAAAVRESLKDRPARVAGWLDMIAKQKAWRPAADLNVLVATEAKALFPTIGEPLATRIHQILGSPAKGGN